jgi:6-phosphogluconolactonase
MILDRFPTRIAQGFYSRRKFLLGASAAAFAHSVFAAESLPDGGSRTDKRFAYVGTYTGAIANGGSGQGIYLYEMNAGSGELELVKLAAETASPSCLALHPSQKYLYAGNEIGSYPGAHGKGGSVTAFAVDQVNGSLKLLNAVSSEGKGPAYISVDRSGKYVLAANYDDGSVAVLPILQEGALGAATSFHKDSGPIGSKRATNAPKDGFAISGHDGPHAHMILASPDNKYVLYTDLGQDRIYVSALDETTGKLIPNNPDAFRSLPSGDGPRHFAFHPNGHWLYSIQEEGSTVAFFHYDAGRGVLASQQTVSTLPAGFRGTNFTSEVLVSPDGAFLYAANRLHDTIAIFAIAADGRLTVRGEVSTLGDYPAAFNIDPSGSFLYACNLRSDSITCFRIERSTGWLKFTGSYIGVGSPGSIVFLS